MIPKKPKHFIEPTSEVLNLPQGLVDDVVSFYWSNVRKELSKLESPSVTINNLGTFKIRFNKLDKVQEKHQYYIDNGVTNTMTFNKHTMKKQSEELIEKLKNLREEMMNEFARHEEVKLKRQAYVANKNLEE